MVRIISCTYNEHAAQILDILNEAIIHSTALYDYKPRKMESMKTWFETKDNHNFPVIGAIAENNMLAGFATYGTFRAWPAYKYSVEHSIYIHKEFRGRGIGSKLLENLISIAKQQDYHVLIGGIDTTNKASVTLHEKLGFVYAGTINHAAFKFGQWLDLGFYQLILDTPANPLED